MKLLSICTCLNFVFTVVFCISAVSYDSPEYQNENTKKIPVYDDLLRADHETRSGSELFHCYKSDLFHCYKEGVDSSVALALYTKPVIFTVTQTTPLGCKYHQTLKHDSKECKPEKKIAATAITDQGLQRRAEIPVDSLTSSYPTESEAEHSINDTSDFITEMYYDLVLITIPVMTIILLHYHSGGELIDAVSTLHGHRISYQILSANLGIWEFMPKLIKYLNWTQITQHLDTAIYSIVVSASLPVISSSEFTLSKKSITVLGMCSCDLVKVSTNSLTIELNKKFIHYYATEPNKYIRQAKASGITGAFFTILYLVRHSILKEKYSGHIILSLPFEHGISCAISNFGKTIDVLIQDRLGDSNFITVTRDPASEVYSGQSLLLAAGVEIFIGLPVLVYNTTLKRRLYYVPYITLNTAGKCFVKVAGYSMVDYMDANLRAKGVQPALSLGAVAVVSFITDNLLWQLAQHMSSSTTKIGVVSYRVASALAPGFGNRYAKFGIKTIFLAALALVKLTF